MTIKDFENWLNQLKKAWEEKDPQLAGAICAENVQYYETPFDKPLTSKKEIIEIWQEVPETQEDIHVNFKILAIEENTCMAHFTANFLRKKTHKRSYLDGIFMVTLNREGECTVFKWWWVEK